MPGLRLRLRDRLVRLRQLLQVVDASGKRIDIGLCGADPQHVQDDLSILGIVLVPAVVQSLSRPGERNRGDQPQLEAGRKQSVGERAMVVAGRLEANEDRSPYRRKISNQAVVIRPGRQHGHPPAAPSFRSFDQDLLAVLGHVDRYQHGAAGNRKALGHGRPRSKVLSRQPHSKDLLAGHDRRDDALRYARLRAPSANG